MKVISEISLKDFEFWSGACDRAKNCTVEDFESIEEMFEELYPEGMTDTEINDFFWFDFDTIVQYLGYDNEEDFDRKHDPNYIDDDELEDYVEDWFYDFLDVVKDNEGTDALIFIYDEIFGEDIEDLCNNDEERTVLKNLEDYPQWLGERAYKFMVSINSDTLMSELFEDDKGHDILKNFPTKEQFRDEMMLKTKRHDPGNDS